MSDCPPPERILIVRPSALGDVCRTVPALVSLRQAYPTARIDWIVRDQFIEAIQAHPDLDEAIPFPRTRFARWWKPAVLSDLRRWMNELAQREYNLVLDLQGLGRSGLITWATRSRRRVGFRSAREFASLGYTVRHPGPRAAHVVDQMLELIAAEGITPVYDLRLYAPPSAVIAWSERQERLAINGAYAVLAPTSRWPGKQWPPARWIELIPHLVERGYETLIILGAPGEEAQVAAIVDQTDPAITLHNLVGCTTIGETMAIIAESALVIASDSAPLHMAVGFDRPLVALFGPTDPAFVGPYGRLDAVVQHPDAAQTSRSQFKNEEIGRRLMERITVQQVMTVVDRVPYPAGTVPTTAGRPQETH